MNAAEKKAPQRRKGAKDAMKMELSPKTYVVPIALTSARRL
jgi:hypothetical protein